MGAGSKLLEGRGLSKSFGGVRALRAFDLSLAEGETLGVIGPNGAGKTTLFDLLSGADRADAGTILLDGRDITHSPPEERARLGLARTFQAGRCFAGLSALDNLLVGAHVDRMAARAGVRFGALGILAELAELAQALLPLGPFRREEEGLRLRAAALAALFGDRLSPRMRDPAYSLSYANRRRLELARSLAGRPRLLLLDEPTAGMNPSETDEMLGFLKTLKAGGLSMIVIEHKLPLVMGISDRVVAMDEGEALAEGGPGEVARDPRVVEAYLGAGGSAPLGSPASGSAVNAPSVSAPSVSAPLLALEGIDSFYGPVQVHYGLSLEVGEAEIVCLLGGNASGKSTAMRIILGLLEPRAGEVLWKGESVNRLSTPERIRLGMASVPEARRIFPDMSVEENLLMGAYVRSGRPGTRSGIKRDMESALELFPRLRERLSQPGGSLSGGEQQMLAIARALMSRPKLICMDEPTMGLAPLFVEKVLETIGELGRRGVSVFMVEQNARQALRIAHRGYVLQNGRLVLQGSSAELLGDPRVRDAYLGGERMSGAGPFTEVL